MKILSTKEIEKIDVLLSKGFILPRSKNYLHQGIKGTRKSNLSFILTNDELKEYILCNNDPIYFIEKYCKIITKNGIKNIKLYDTQKESIKIYLEKKLIIYLSARQSGTDLMSSLLFLHQMTFNDDFSIISKAHKILNECNIIRNIKTAYINLPFFLKKGLINFSSTNITFENGSFINISKKPIASSNILYMQDFAFYDNQEKIFQTIYPTVTARTSDKLLISSSYNGHTFFNDLVNSSKFTVQKIKWDDIPNRNEQWKENCINIVGKEKFNQVYNLEMPNI